MEFGRRRAMQRSDQWIFGGARSPPRVPGRWWRGRKHEPPQLDRATTLADNALKAPISATKRAREDWLDGAVSTVRSLGLRAAQVQLLLNLQVVDDTSCVPSRLRSGVEPQDAGLVIMTTQHIDCQR